VKAQEWWSSEEAREYQLGQLRGIVRLAYENTAYYRRVFDSVGFRPDDLRSIDDLSRLPIIDRGTIRSHVEEMCARPTSHRSVDYCSTGGTGGEPLFFYMGRERSAIEYAYLTQTWRRVGYRLGMPMAVLRGRPVRQRRNGLRHEYDPILHHHHYSSFFMSDEDLRRYLDHIGTIGTCFLHVYPSTVAALAKFIRRTGVQPPVNIQGIIAESERVYPRQREVVENTFGCRYFSCYGHSEKLVLAAECEHSSDYHVWPTYGYFELLDECDRPVTTPGQRGEIVGTGFINTVVPFIRYRTGDFATYVADRCESCGRQHVIIRDIHGHRTQEVLLAADGSEIPWAAVNMHDDTFLRVRQFQFYQDTPGRAVLRIVPAEAFRDEEREQIVRRLDEKLEGRIAIRTEIVDSIRLTARGKAIYVEQKMATRRGAGLAAT